MSILVIDVGTSGVRAAVVTPDADGRRTSTTSEVLPDVPDARPRRVRRRRHGRRRARRAPAGRCADAGPGRRRRHRQPAGLHHRLGPRHRRAGRRPASGWQDLRTVGDCLVLQADGLRLAPNHVGHQDRAPPRPADPDREPRPVLRHRRHVDRLAPHRGRGRTSPTRRNAGVTGLRRRRRRTGWDDRGARRAAASRAVDAADDRRLHRRRRRGHRARRARRPSPASPATSRRRSSARAACAPGRPRSPSAPAACSTSCVGPDAPGVRDPGRRRHLPDRGLAARRRDHVGPRGDHAVGRHQRRVAARRPRAHPDRRRVARGRRSGATTPTASSTCRRCSAWARPHWDYGARGALLGVTRGTDAAHIVRAVLEGVAHRGADLVEAAETDGGLAIPVAAGRRRHERQPDLRAGAGRRRAATGRGLAGDRGHHPRRRASWPGSSIGTWGGLRRHRRDLAARDRRSSPASPPTASAGPGPSSGRRRGSPSCPASTSDRPTTEDRWHRRPAAPGDWR